MNPLSKHFYRQELFFLCFLLLLWQLLACLSYVPPITKIGQIAWQLFLHGDAIYHISLPILLFASLKILLLAFAGAFITAVPLGLFLGYHRMLDQVLSRYLEIVRPVPPLAWIPLGYALFSNFPEPTYYVQLLVVYAGAFFPLFTAAVYGVRSVDPLLLDAAKTLGAHSNWQLLSRVVLPSAMPSIFWGIKSALGVGWMCIVAAEFVGGKMGIGAYIWSLYNLGGRMTEIMIAVFLVGFTGCFMNFLINLVERSVLAWYYQ